MRRVRWPFAAALVLSVAAGGCKRDRPYPVERVEIGAWGSLSRAGLSASRSDVESALKSHLGAAGFQLLDVARDEEAPEGALKLSLDVPMAQADPPRVGVRLQL